MTISYPLHNPTSADRKTRQSSPAGEREGVSNSLAQFVAQTRFEDLPAPAVHEAKRSLVNFFAVALSGSRAPEIEQMVRVLCSFGGPGSATLIGRREMAQTLDAAFLNAASANVFDFDDAHPTIIHPTAPVAPSLLALADQRPVSGRDLLLAFVLGVEVECRLGNAVYPEHYRRGWHITSTCGVFGAAAAAGKLLKLDRHGLLAALGSASAQSSGNVECLGTGAKSVGVGNAARNGLVAALFAEAGLSGPANPLEGRYGFLALAVSAPKHAEITDALGDSWEILQNTYKPYPCGVVLNPVIEACLALVQRPEITPGTVEQVVVQGHPLLVERTDRASVASGRLSQVSAQHAVAAVLATGAAGIAQFSDEAVRDEQVVALRQKVVVEPDPDMPVGAAAVTVRLADGTEAGLRIDDARGSVTRPLTDADLENKLSTLAGSGHSSCDPQRLAEAVWTLDQTTDCRELLRLAAPRRA